MDIPPVQPVTTADIELVYEKKLELIEREAQSLYQYCLKKKFSTSQVRQCLTPLIGERKSVVSRVITGSVPALVQVAVLVALIAILIKWPTANRILAANTKILSIQTLAVYDWTKFYDEDCLLENPYLPKKETTKQDCQGCIDFRREMGRIERLRDINDTVITDGFLYYDIPVIVKDPLKDWPRTDDGELVLSLNKIKELYLTEPKLQSGFEACEFHTTLDQDNMTVHDFVRRLDSNDLPEKFNAAWENCEPKAAKIFRLYTKRPYFLPAMAEASRANQIMLAKGTFEDVEPFRIPQQQDSASWLIAIKGSLKITITPTDDCKKFKCRPAKFKLKQGEAAVIPTRIWTPEYTPLGPGLTLVFSSTVLWDDVV